MSDEDRVYPEVRKSSDPPSHSAVQGKIMDRVMQALEANGMSVADVTVEASKGVPVISVIDNDSDGGLHYHLSVEASTVGIHEFSDELVASAEPF